MGKPRVLIEHAEGHDSTELAERLAALGYEVAGAVPFGEQTSEGELALVVMDRVPGASAEVTAAAHAVRRYHPVPVVFVTDSEEDVRRQQVGEELPYEHVVAPFNDRELRLTLRLALLRGAAARAVHQFEGFFSISQDLFCFLDFSGYFKRLNPAWETTLGFTREELMSRPFIEFVHPDDRERTLGQNREVRGGGRARTFQNRYLCKDGSYRWLLWNSAPVEADKVIYAVARDVTLMKAEEEEKARLVRELYATLAEVETLQGILPICSYCRKIRDDKDYWESVEDYLARHTRTRFSHGICPDCMSTIVEPQLEALGHGDG
jgi:PAS domain S-box-containing protein